MSQPLPGRAIPPREWIVDRAVQEPPAVPPASLQLPSGPMAAAGFTVGDLVEVTTRRGRRGIARLAAPWHESSPLAAVRMDRFLRQALRLRVQETVRLAPAEERPIERVAFRAGIDLSASQEAALRLTAHFRRQLVAGRIPVGPGMLLHLPLPSGHAGMTLQVVQVEGGPGVIGEGTLVEWLPPEAAVDAPLEVTFEDVGGLGQEIRLLRELVQLPLQYPQIYRQLGIRPPRGVILYGPPGSGKTHLARAIAHEVQARFFYINGPDVVGSGYGETEANLRKIFSDAAHNAPALIFIDELDAVAPRRGDSGSQTDTRMVTQLLTLLDGLQQVDGVIAIATTNRIEAIDVALRRPGRFDREIFIGPPTAEGRREILEIHTREMPLSDAARDLLAGIAERTHGYVGADLMELCREAGLSALRRSAMGLGGALDLIRPEMEELQIEPGDLEEALARIRPSGIREVWVQVPDVRWDDVVGLEEEKRRLRDWVIRPLLHPDAYREARVTPPAGVLLHGPSGTGKTMLAKAVAAEAGVNFIAVEGPEVFSKWLGESEEAVRHLFRVARQLAPSILFIDQLDAVARSRGGEDGARAGERVVSQLLSELDGVRPLQRLVVIGACNRIDLLDPAILRPGRLGLHLALVLPDAEARRRILAHHLAGLPWREEADREGLLRRLADATEGWSGADLRAVAEQAKLFALEEGGWSRLPPLREEHVERAWAEFSRAPSGRRPRPARRRGPVLPGAAP